jgi:hypothetical protein
MGEADKVKADTYRNAAATAVKEALKLKTDQVTIDIVGESDWMKVLLHRRLWKV